jgi:hypothetical protein
LTYATILLTALHKITDKSIAQLAPVATIVNYLTKGKLDRKVSATVATAMVKQLTQKRSWLRTWAQEGRCHGYV